jgi:hypothetical protein
MVTCLSTCLSVCFLPARFFLISLSAYLVILGFGVFATREFSRGDYLLEYRGTLLSASEGRRKEPGCPEWLYFFGFSGKKYW